MLPLSMIQAVIVERCKRWYGEGDWSILEWAACMCGESGEAANAAKKLKRIDDGQPNINEPARSLTDRDAARLYVAKEVADVIIYGLILVDRCGFSPEEFEKIIADVFNKKSEEYGFPERLSA